MSDLIVEKNDIYTQLKNDIKQKAKSIKLDSDKKNLDKLISDVDQKRFKQDLIMSDENKQILDQVTELISSKKEILKENVNESKQDPENTQNSEIEEKKRKLQIIP